MDAAGPEHARRFYEQAGVTFFRGIDRDDALWDALGFHVLPNGVLVDERGVVRHATIGGFDIRDERHREIVERWLAQPLASAPTEDAPSVRAQALEARASSPPGGRDEDAQPRTSAEWFREGTRALERGDREAAARSWRKALEIDPDNFVIRKQIWALEHPEQFYPEIDAAWQRERLAAERKAGAR